MAQKINELHLIGKVLDDPTLTTYSMLIELGVSSGFFVTAHANYYWTMLEGYVTAYRSVPTRKYLYDLYTQSGLREVPIPKGPQEDIRAIKEIVQERNNRTKLSGIIAQAANMFDRKEPVDRVIEALQRSTSVLNLKDELIVKQLNKSMEDHIDRYIRILRGEMSEGFLWPWDTLNNVSRITESLYFGFYGRPKNMKTYALLWLGCHVAKQGGRVMFLSPEITEIQYNTRMISICAGLDETLWRKKKLSEEEAKALLLTDITKYPITYVHLSEYSVPVLRRDVMRRSPDLVLVDALHKFYDEETGKADQSQQVVRNVARNTTKLTRDLHVPLGFTAQANRESEKQTVRSSATGDVGFSDALSQEVDILFRVKKTKDNLDLGDRAISANKKANVIGDTVLQIYTVATRDFDPVGFTTDAFPGVSFTERYPYIQEEGDAEHNGQRTQRGPRFRPS